MSKTVKIITLKRSQFFSDHCPNPRPNFHHSKPVYWSPAAPHLTPPTSSFLQFFTFFLKLEKIEFLPLFRSFSSRPRDKLGQSQCFLAFLVIRAQETVKWERNQPGLAIFQLQKGKVEARHGEKCADRTTFDCFLSIFERLEFYRRILEKKTLQCL